MVKINKIIKNKWFKYFYYSLFISIMTITLLLLGKYTKISQFIESVELKTLDFRFKVSHKHIKPNPKIVILSIDDTSLQILENRFGIWPWTRNAYAQAIEYMESGKVDSINFDLMFVGYQKGNEDKDIEFIETLGKYNNIYVSMNFDGNNSNLTPVLDNKFSIDVDNNSKKINLSHLTFTNYRPIIKEILDNTSNMGFINFIRDEDGIARRSPVFMKFNDKFYPHLAFKSAFDHLKKYEKLKQNKFVINKNNEFYLGKRKIKLDNNGLMVLNWYGPTFTYEYVPFWKIIKSISDIEMGKAPLIPPSYFKDKVVFCGITATSLFDIKSTPLSRIYPGVELQATTFNNLIDGNSIKRAPSKINLLVCIFLSIITGIIVIRLRSVVISSLLSISVAVLYIVLSVLLLERHIWIGIVNQIIFIVTSFIFMYIVKYLLKSRDYEYTYKLATTDGLTNLYNHRHFQENLVSAIEKSKKTEIQFSLVLIDIDYFKKFNDTYGHQAGDIVLKKVAEILKKSVKSSDFVARYGGEEMVIILSKTSLDKALSVANRLCKAVSAKQFKLSDDLEVNVTISLGVSSYPLHGTNPAELIDFADKGLYRAKLNGRNQVGEIPDYITKGIPEDEEEVEK